MQQLSKWWYNFAVGQVQTVFKFSKEDIVAVKDFFGLAFVDVNTCIRKDVNCAIDPFGTTLIQLSRRKSIAIMGDQGTTRRVKMFELTT